MLSSNYHINALCHAATEALVARCIQIHTYYSTISLLEKDTDRFYG